MDKGNNEHKKEKDFNFIEEKVISRKRQKVRKVILMVISTIVLGLLFGLAATLAFTLSEEPLYKLLGKGKKVVEFPSDEDIQDINKQTEDSTEDPSEREEETSSQEEVDPVIIEKKIAADINDLASIYIGVKKIAEESSKAMVLVTSTVTEKDWFENEIEIPNETIGLIVANNNVDLLVLVNYDRVKSANKIMVSFDADLEAQASLQSFDSELNIAIIAVPLQNLHPDLKDLEPAELGQSSYLPIGTPVIAIGSPNGYSGSIELAMINSKRTEAYITDYEIDLFHTDANYVGGAEGYVINTKGTIVGIMTTHLRDNKDEKVSTFIGISSVKPIIERLVNNKSRAYFGIEAIDITSDVLSEMGLENAIAVTRVVANSPAFDSGIQVGDLIISLDDNKIGSVRNFQNRLLLAEPGDLVKVKLQREQSSGNGTIEVQVTLKVRKI